MRRGSHGGPIQNAAIVTGGWALIAAGVLTLPVPGTFSTPVIALGGIVLVRRSPGFRHGVARLRTRFPETSTAVTRSSRHWPRSIRYLVLRTDPLRVH